MPNQPNNTSPDPSEWTTIIRPSKGWVSLRLHDLWEYRDLIMLLAWRDISVRYKQTVLGAAWAVIQPFFSMVIFSVFFGGLAQVSSDGLPYPVFSYTALLPWTFFANSLTLSANSLVGNANLLSKVYFPRLVIPLASTISGLVDFAIAFVVLLIIMLFYGMLPTTAVILLPLFLLLALITALGAGLWLSALNVEYRDIRYAVPFLIQALMFASPVVYSSTLLEEPWRTLYGLNPLVGVIEGFRWALLGSTPPGTMILISAVAAVALLVSGMLYFRRMEKNFADMV
ncbi:MAG: ABC transporter permease [Chloroflexi bacterium]|jgi:lipopolysaccharide transport system permease protein|uniref:ABC transporter permease n=1 Tax=Candidatus Flexifilum breve TaxID=3140694 RepID=UPI0031358F01|nr:ABC transporter permease [Chloroflexota bacterium]